MNKFNKITVCVEGKKYKGRSRYVHAEDTYNQETQWNGCFQGKQTPVQDLDIFKTKKCQGKTCIGGEIKRRD